MNNEQIKMMLTLLNEILLQLRKKGAGFSSETVFESAAYTQIQINKMCATEQYNTKQIDNSGKGLTQSQCGRQCERVTVMECKSGAKKCKETNNDNI